MNSEENPTHAFVVNRFGFCQEVYEEYDEVFLMNVIVPYIEGNGRMKLRMYNPGKYMRNYLDTRPFAAKSERVHMIHKKMLFLEEKIPNNQGFRIKEMTNEEIVRDDFGLDLVCRYYNGADDFLKKANALAAYSTDEEIIGIVYSAGEALGICEKDIFVKESFRGKGIAKALTKAFIKKCSKQHKLVSEDIYINNVASIAVAKANGAEMIGSYDYFNIAQF